jgi:hypothetical protein
MDFLFGFKILLIIIIVISGIILFSNGRLWPGKDGFTNRSIDNGNQNCPDLLIQNGEQFYLYNSKAPTVKGHNPMIFSKLSDYANFVNSNPSCPVLFLQKGTDTQGNDVYNVRGGTPMKTWQYNGIHQNAPIVDGGMFSNFLKGDFIRTTPFLNNSVDSKVFNQYGFAPYDAYGFDVGRFTPLDAISHSQELLAKSDSANDANWAGETYTQEQVDSGKYILNEVYRPNLSNTTRIVK